MRNTGVGAEGHDAARSHTGGPSRPTGVPSIHGPRCADRVVRVVTAASVAVCLFSAGVLYGELDSGPVPGAAAAPAPTPTQEATSPAPTVTAPAPTVTVTVPAPVDVPVVEQPVDAGLGAPPVQLTIPDLGIDQRLIGLRVTSDRRLQVPESYDEIGWWSDGPAPGDPGAALMVGHVDSQDGPAVFYGLSTLEPGAVISARGADGRTLRFAVTGMQSFPKDDFPDELVYRTDGKPSLHLVTCGGSFDYETGHYRDNVVVFADLIEEVPPPVVQAQPPVATPAQSAADVPGGVTAEEKASADLANAAIAEAAADRTVTETDEEGGP